MIEWQCLYIFMLYTQFLYDMSSEFRKLNGYFNDFQDDEDEQKSMNANSQQLFGSPHKYPSQFNLSTRNLSDNDGSDEMINEMNEANTGNDNETTQMQQNLVWYQHKLQWFREMAESAIFVLKLFYKNSNVFDSNNGYSSIQCITERLEDTAITKISRQANCNLSHIGRSCIAGALLRYFQDMNEKESDDNKKEDDASLENARILESFDLSQNSTELISNLNEVVHSTEIPLFKESIGLTSIELCIGEDYQTPRSRLMSIAHQTRDMGIYYRIAFWINKFFKFACIFLPDLVSKKVISTLVQNHTMELCYFQYDDNFILGSEPVEDLRVFKTNLNIPCLCISSYNEHISLDLTFTSISIKNPAGLIQGFLAELEQLEAMFR